jgi:hypothetical protein
MEILKKKRKFQEEESPRGDARFYSSADLWPWKCRKIDSRIQYQDDEIDAKDFISQNPQSFIL